MDIDSTEYEKKSGSYGNMRAALRKILKQRMLAFGEYFKKKILTY